MLRCPCQCLSQCPRLLNQRPEEAQRILEQAGDRGSRVHAAIRDLLSGLEVRIDRQYPSEVAKGRFEPLTAEEWNCLRGFANWCKDYKPNVFGQELTVMNDEVGYAGTIDFIGSILLKSERIPILIDWKTSSGIWNEYKLQVAAYWNAWNDNRISPRHTAIVRVGTKHKNKYEMQLFDIKETTFHLAKFIEVKNLHSFVDPEKEPKIEDLPTSLKVEVEIWQPPKPQAEKGGGAKKPRHRTARKTKKQNVGKTNQ